MIDDSLPPDQLPRLISLPEFLGFLKKGAFAYEKKRKNGKWRTREKSGERGGGVRKPKKSVERGRERKKSQRKNSCSERKLGLYVWEIECGGRLL